jgi:hypothetical protein
MSFSPTLKRKRESPQRKLFGVKHKIFYNFISIYNIEVVRGHNKIILLHTTREGEYAPGLEEPVQQQCGLGAVQQ